MSFLDGIFGSDKSLQNIIEGAWREPAASLAKGMNLSGDRKVVDASDAFRLEGTGSVWLVLSGSLDILWASGEGRIYLGTVTAGKLAFAMSSKGEPAQTLALPSEGTELIKTSWSAVSEYLGQNNRISPAALVELWLALFFAKSADMSAALSTKSLPDWTQGLETLHENVVQRASAQFQAAQGERQRRFEKANLKLSALVENELSQTAELIDRHYVPVDRSGRVFHSAALQTLRATGFHETLDVTLPKEGESELDLVGRFARRNNLQFRAVELPETWWKGSHGPLLGRYRSSREPVALIPVPGGYEIHNEQGANRVTRQLGESIDATAYAFFLPIPESVESAWNLFSFGLFGAGRDVRNIIFCLILSALFSIVPPIAIGWLISSVIPSAELNQVRVFTALLLVVAIAGAMTGIVQSLAAIRIEGSMEYRVQSSVWVRILNLQANFFRKFNAGDLASRADSIDAMRSILGKAFSALLASSVGLIFSLLLMLYYDWRAALFVFLLCVLFSLIAIVYGRYILHFNQQVLDTNGKMQGLTLQILSSVPKLRVAGADLRAFANWLNVFRRMTRLSLHQRILNYRLLVLRSAFPYMVTLVVLASIGHQLGILFDFFADNPSAIKEPAKPFKTSTFVSFNVALGQFTAAVFLATRGVLQFFLLHPHYQRVKPILEAPEEQNAGYGELEDARGNITFKNVSFRYSDKSPLALSEVSFRAEANKRTAVVGVSGAGKSTVLRLLLGFEKPESGTILVDGTDMRFLNKKSLRHLFGVVIQNENLMSGSIYDNVAVGHPYSAEEVTEALRIADLADEIEKWPMGLNTMIGEGAATLSEGQQQRLMIARTVVRKPKILLLDEATSALDNVTQATVTKNLSAMNCTQIVVAHRLSTIQGADNVVVFDNGEVVEQGRYEDLANRDGPFATLIARQLQ